MSGRSVVFSALLGGALAQTSPYPIKLSMRQMNYAVACANHMSFVEVMAFSNTGQNVASQFLGANTALSTTSGTGYSFNGNDMYVDPASASANNLFVNGACTGTTVGSGDVWNVTFAAPTPISTVYYINRLDSCCVNRVNTSQTVITLLATNLSVVATAPIKTGATVSTFTFNDYQTAPVNPNLASAFQTSSANMLALPRYIRITSAPGKCLTFREVFVFDNTYTNVALLKTATMSTGAAYSDAYGVYGPSMGNDGIIVMDQMGGNMVSLPCDGSGWWQVDLGGIYNVTRLMIFNNFPGPSLGFTGGTTGATYGNVMIGATVTYYNSYFSVIGNNTLNGLMIQNVNATFYPPSASRTPTPSSTGTSSITGTPTQTLTSSSTGSLSATSSGTATSSASLSFGTTPSATGSPSGTATITSTPTNTGSQTPTNTASSSHTPSNTGSATSTPSNTPTSTQTPTPTSTPLSAYPYKLTLSQRNATVACLQHMNFVEIMVFSSSGQLISASSLGAVASLTSTSGSSYASYGNDLIVDPATAVSAGYFVNGACSTTVFPSGDTWTLNFPPATGYPQGFPQPVASVYYINRIDSCCIFRANTSLEAVSLISPNGTTVAQRAITSGAPVTTFTFNDAQTGPIFPDLASAFQTSASNLQLLPRYIRITSAGLQCLTFRELFVLDTSLVNVALFKSATMSTGSLYSDALGNYTPAMGVDGIVDMDALGGNMVSLPCDGSGWWQLDLGGIYNITKLIMFNHYPGPASNQNGALLGTALNGATVTLLNTAMSPVGSATLSNLMIQAVPITLYAPSPTNTPSQTTTASTTASMTASVSNTASATYTSTSSGSATASASLTPSSTSSPSATISGGALPSHSATQTCTPSQTPSSSGTGTRTPTQTSTPSPTTTASSSNTGSSTGSPTNTPTQTPTLSPLSAYPYKLTLAQTNAALACSNHMDFVELMVFSSSGQLISASSLGAVASLTSTSGSAYASYGNDLIVDPATASSAGQLVNGACSTTVFPTGDMWSLTFPPATGYPQGFPQPVASVYYINRIDSCCTFRVNTSAEVVSLISPNGTAVAQRAITTGATVTTMLFNDAQTGPIFPDLGSAFQTSTSNLQLLPRYVRITSAPGKCLTFREVFALDTSLINVALFKSATMSTGANFVNSLGSFTPAMGNDGVVDMDALGGNMVSLPCDGSGWWQLDLGGIYNISKVMIFNNFPGPTGGQPGAALGAQMTGATLTLLNTAMSPVGSATLSNLMIQAVPITLYAPSATSTPSPTQSPTNTGTATASQTTTPSITATSTTSASISFGTTPSHTGSATNTASPSNTGTETQSATGTPTPSTTQTATPTLSTSPTWTGSNTGTASPTPTPSNRVNAFQPGSLLLVRAGDGVATQMGVYAQLFVDEVSPTSGAVLQTLSLPSATSGANFRCVVGINGSSPLLSETPTEGLPSLTFDGTAVLIACNDALLGSTLSTSAPTGGRTVAVIASDARVDTSTHVTGWIYGGTPTAAGAFHSAVAMDLSASSMIYLSGYVGGSLTNGATTGSSYAMIPYGKNTGNIVLVTGQGSYLQAQGIYPNVNGTPQLFTGSYGGSSGPGMCAVGTSPSTYLPTAQTTAAVLPGIPTTLQVTAFVFSNTTRLYLAESVGLTLQVWDYNRVSGQWSKTSSQPSLTSKSSPWSLVGRVEGGAYVLYATNATTLVAYNTVTGVQRVVKASSSSNTFYTGVVFAPVNGGFLPDSPSSSNTPSATPSNTKSPSNTASISGSPSSSSSASITASSASTLTPTLTRTSTKTPTTSRTGTRTTTPSASVSASGSISTSGTGTPSSAVTSTPTGSHSATMSTSASASSSHSASASISATSPATKSVSKSPLGTKTSTKSNSGTATGSPSGTISPSASLSAQPTGSTSLSGTPLASGTPVSTGSVSGTGSSSATPVPSSSLTPTMSPSQVVVVSATSSATRSATPSRSPTKTGTPTRSPSKTATPSRTGTHTRSSTHSPTHTRSQTHSPTRTRSASKKK